MKTTVNVHELCYDNIDNIQSAIDLKEDFEIIVCEGEMEDEKNTPCVSVWIEKEDSYRNKCTIMFHLTLKDAMYLAKGIINIAEPQLDE